MLGWMTHKMESGILEEISTTTDTWMISYVDAAIRAESEEKLKSLLIKMKKEIEKAGLNLNTQKTKIMATSPITLWQIVGETMETVRDFILGGSKITADGDCNHEIKRRLLLGRKAMINPDSLIKSRDVPLLTKVCLVKAIVFPVIIYGCELDYKESLVPKN